MTVRAKPGPPDKDRLDSTSRAAYDDGTPDTFTVVGTVKSINLDFGGVVDWATLSAELPPTPNDDRKRCIYCNSYRCPGRFDYDYAACHVTRGIQTPTLPEEPS